MRLTWKKDARETGLRAIGAAPQGSKLHDGVKTYAVVSPLGGGWRGPVTGWYLVSGWDSDVPYKNTSDFPCKTVEEAKTAARAYVTHHLRAQSKE